MSVFHSIQVDLDLMYTTDAVHLGYHKPMHHLPLVACQLDFHPPRLPRRGCNPHSWLRGRPRVEQEVREQQRGVREQLAK